MKLVVIISFWFAFSSCESSSSTERDLNDSSQEKLAEPVVQKLPKNAVILGSDTLIVEDEGKVYGIQILNDTLYSYRTFKADIPESDVGLTRLKVKSKTDVLLWETEIKREHILSDGQSMVMIDFETNCVRYYTFNGQLENDYCLADYDLTDANDYAVYEGGLLIKLVKEDYSLRDLLLVEKGSKTGRLLNLDLEGYYNLKMQDGQVVLIDNEKRVVEVFD